MAVREVVRLAKATGTDVETLRLLQKEAFDSEALAHLRAGPGGPEGYDTREGQIALMERGDYLKITLDGRIVGGVVVNDSGTSCRLVRIFVGPDHQCKGIGRMAFGLLSGLYPGARSWELDTPSWSLRNHRFYESLGFVKVGETDEGDRGFRLFLFEKRIG